VVCRAANHAAPDAARGRWLRRAKPIPGLQLPTDPSELLHVLVRGAARAVVPRMHGLLMRRSLDSGLALATVVLGLDRQGWITVFAALLLALITLLTSYSHVDLLGAASVDLPQQAGLPCIAAALATAVAEAELETNRRFLELVAAGLAESVRP